MAGLQASRLPELLRNTFAESVTSHPADGLATQLIGRTLAQRNTAEPQSHLRVKSQISGVALVDWGSCGTRPMAAALLHCRYDSKRACRRAARQPTRSRLKASCYSSASCRGLCLGFKMQIDRV